LTFWLIAGPAVPGFADFDSRLIDFDLHSADSAH
jgi:hypothetical protein